MDGPIVDEQVLNDALLQPENEAEGGDARKY